MLPKDTPEIPFGYCHCGCGQKTKIANHTYRERGHVKGQPVRYIKGHWTKPGPEYIEDNTTGCWEWQRAKVKSGHGRVRAYGTSYPAHRLYYERAYGPIPSDHDIHHRCQNPGCVNPDHLEPLHKQVHRSMPGRKYPKNRKPRAHRSGRSTIAAASPGAL